MGIWRVLEPRYLRSTRITSEANGPHDRNRTGWFESIYGGTLCYFFENARMVYLDDDLVVALGYFFIMAKIDC